METLIRGGTPTQGFRRLLVAAVTSESDTIRSFVLEPVDGAPLPPFKPGQFVVTRVEPDDGDAWLRNYSLSGDPDDPTLWRISVKREPAPQGRVDLPAGRMSNYLHEHVEVGAHLDVKGPSGAFVLDETSERAVVLLSGGVGVTPMISMLHRLTAHTARTVHFIHACESGAVHAFRDEVMQLAARRPNVTVHVCYRRPGDDDFAQSRFDSAGLITRETLQRLLPLDDYDVYLCGPPPFMQANWRLLRSLGVTRSRIHYEFFGPATVLEEDGEQPVRTVNVTPVPVALSAPCAGPSPQGGPAVVMEPSGRTFSWDASCHSLLDFCEQAGFAPAFSCRAGVCGTCSTTLVAGEVTYFEPPLDPPPDGEVLLCCARPVTPVRLKLTQSS